MLAAVVLAVTSAVSSPAPALASPAPDIAAKIARSIGNFTASQGAEELMDPRTKAQFAESFPDGMKNMKWYPTIPPGLEEIEGRVLDRVKAAN